MIAVQQYDRHNRLKEGKNRVDYNNSRRRKECDDGRMKECDATKVETVATVTPPDEEGATGVAYSLCGLMRRLRRGAR